MLCVVVRAPSMVEVKEKIEKAVAWQPDLIEWRLDGLPVLPFQEIQEVLATSSLPMIFTLRKGEYPGTEEQRLRDLCHLAALAPAYLDIEFDVEPACIHRIQRDFPSVQLILSRHVEKTMLPEQLFGEMPTYPNVLYKGAMPVTESIATLQMLSFAKRYPLRMTSISLGESGSFGRVMGPLVGNVITYAALDTKEAVAPGQLSIEELRKTYHMDRLGLSTALYCLLGDPVEQSISHQYHNALFAKKGHDAVYVKIRVAPSELEEAFSLLLALGLRGCSVTMPHKEAILPLLDEIDPVAQGIGAVNTIHCVRGKIYGFNTDGEAAVQAMEESLPLSGRDVLILGAGGAARAIGYVAKERGASVILCGREVGKTRRVAQSIGVKGDSIETVPNLPYDFLINATPSLSPIPPTWIRPGSVVMDIHTRPKKTSFLQAAEKKGAKILYGEEMFVRQAFAQYKIWFESSLLFSS